MKTKKKYLAMVIAAAGLLAITACNSGGGDNGGGNSGGNTGGDTTVDLVDDVERDDDGKTILFDSVELKLWAVGGEPDATTMDKVIKAFNQSHPGEISVTVQHINEENYYSQLDSTWRNDPTEFPDFMWIHNNKIGLYAGKSKGYILPMTEEVMEKGNCTIDFDQCYSGIDRCNILNGTRYSISMDAHGFLTYFRQDIIKKNNLGFDNNTRFIPESYDEYHGLLKSMKEKAAAGTLLVRNINKGSDHAWHAADSSFAPSFQQSTDPDGLTSLYANGGSLMDDSQSTVTFQNCDGFVKYCTDQVEGYEKGYWRTGTNTALFGEGGVAMFSEGPWWSSSQYEPNYNNSELRSENAALHVSAEDAADDVYSHPFAASHAKGWWTTAENENASTAQKWYGLGHSIAISSKVKNVSKIGAIFEFAKYYAREKNSSGKYNLVDWCTSGHIPAWKDVYESDEFKEKVNSGSSKITLQGLGNPDDIICLESLEYEDTVFSSFQSIINQVQSAVTGDGCTVEQAKKYVTDGATACQESINMMKLLG